MKLNKRFIALFLLILINIVIRYPLTPHELGTDSFVMHAMANSIVNSGQIKWMLHPLSFFGFYPMSYASLVPTLLAEMSIITGLSTEKTILLMSMLFGVFGVLTSYVMASQVRNDEFFKLLVAFVFSLSPLSLKFTVWTISTRGLFLMLMPLFIWSLLRLYKTRSGRQLFITFILLVSLAGIHKMFVLLSFIFLALIASSIFTNFYERFINRFGRPSHMMTSLALTVIFPLLFLFEFEKLFPKWYMRYLRISLIGYLSRAFPLVDYRMVNLWTVIGARLGFILIFAFLGVLILIWKRKRTSPELFFMFSLLFLIPIYGDAMYVYQFSLPIISVLGVIGILHLSTRFKHTRTRQAVILISLSVMLIFSFITLINRYGGEVNYMHDKTYHLALLFGNLTEGTIITNAQLSAIRISSISHVPVMPGKSDRPEVLLAGYNLHGEDDFILNKKGIPGGEFSFIKWIWYVKEPYKVSLNPDIAYDEKLYTYDLDDPKTESIFHFYDVGYMLENERIGEKRKLFRDIRDEWAKIYDNGAEGVWEDIE